MIFPTSILKYLFLIVLTLGLIVLPQVVRAQSSPPNQSSYQVRTPQLPGTLQVEIPRVYFVKGVLTAEIQLKNDTPKDILNVMYGIQVLSPQSSVNTVLGQRVTGGVHPGWLVGYQDYDFFNLKSGEVSTKKVEYKLGSGFENGVYRLLVQLKSQDNQILGYQTQTFNLVGDGRFISLSPERCVVQVGNTSYDPSDGPIINPTEQGQLVCDLTNPTSAKIDAIYNLEYAVRSVAINPISKSEVIKLNQGISLNPGETKKAALTIPKIESPQVYQGLFYLTDLSGNKLSVTVDFRWTVPGHSATILTINSEKEAYETGEEAIINVVIDPSADISWRSEASKQLGTDLEAAVLKVTLTDRSGEVCGVSESPLPKTSEDPAWPAQKVAVKINKNCPDFTVKAEIANNGQVLAEVEKGYGIPLFAGQTETASEKNTNNYIWWFVGTLAIVLIAALLGFLRYKKNKSNTPPPNSPLPPTPIVPTSTTVAGLLITLSLFSLIGIQKASADTIKEPVDTPIENRTVNFLDTLEDHEFWGNVSNFSAASVTGSASSSATPLGKSTISTNDDCNVANLYLYGYADARYCGNFSPGLEAHVFIDGVPVEIANVISPESTVARDVNEANVFSLIGRAGGLRTGNATLTVPATSQQSGQHKIEVRVGAAGYHYKAGGGYNYESTFATSSRNHACGKDEPCYMLMSASYTCGKCPEGQSKPHFECDPVTGCKEVDTCGVSTCVPGQDQCEACDDPNETKPHLSCVNNACVPTNSCGAPSCNNTGDCCPEGTVYDAEADKCLAPACNVTCTSDEFCGDAKDGCTECAPNLSGKNVCQTPFNDAMCKCDGFNAINVLRPSEGEFKFEAFGMVKGEDVSRAKIDKMTFTLHKSAKNNPNISTIISTSSPITPTVVSTDNGIVRYRAEWSVKPPAYDPNAIYRVGAKPTCVKKTGPLSAAFDFKGDVPLYSSDNSTVLGEELNYSPVRLVQTNENLELGTLKDGYFTRILEADSCSFIRFEYGQY